ncbi:hypothetical protein PF008_g7786 [Phytophthora fragariae]|uniref:Uncharacterized protein n=1 Tax=Phytophthora fragariae TaxID=53985 RepID=A0A6G0S1F8_9STRA|nr:hypothetical protein PF008_g7786 [Phytophthora fragariae]
MLRATHQRPGHAAARRKAVYIGSYKYIFCVDVNSVELTRKTGRLETGTNTTMADKYSLNPMFQKVAVAKSVLTHSPTKQLEAEGKQVRSLCVGDPDCDPHERMQASGAKARRVELTRKTGRLETSTNTTMADKYSLNPMFQKMTVELM